MVPTVSRMSPNRGEHSAGRERNRGDCELVASDGFQTGCGDECCTITSYGHTRKGSAAALQHIRDALDDIARYATNQLT